MLRWRRVRFTLCASILVGLVLGLVWPYGLVGLLVRTVLLGFSAMLAFRLFERWPKRLPAWFARWVLQVLGAAVVVPLATVVIYMLSIRDGASPFWDVPYRLGGYKVLTALAMLLALGAALGAVVWEKDATARHQALAFDLERSEFERQALDARLRLLQAQVAPHFLFNTLANVQVLVDAGSARASAVLGSLIAYLRAAVPRLHEPATTLDQELQLVQAYLELMHMRMPDRLHFEVKLPADASALSLACPPMTLLTLVENAVRHGIDPSEEGGRIEIDVQRRADRCVVRVSDTGVGLQQTGSGLGTGLSTLRERLELSFGGDAHLRVSAQEPRGVIAEVDLPAQMAGS